MSCVRALVCVIQQGIWAGCMATDPIDENTGTGSVSPPCSTITEKSIVRPSMRGGVPVFKRPCGSLNSLRRAAKDVAGASPARPPA